MKCPRCGNEVNPEEAFCGQCGSPTRPPAAPTEMINTQSPRPGYRTTHSATGTPNTSMPGVPGMSVAPSSSIYQRGTPPVGPTGSMNIPYGGPQSPFPAPGIPSSVPTNQRQPSQFYQDATEAMSIPPASVPGYPTASASYTPPGFASPAQQGPSQMYGTAAPFPTSNLAPSQLYNSGASYDNIVRNRIVPPLKQSNSTLLIVAIICLVFVFIAVVALGTFILLKNHNASTTSGPSNPNGGTTIVNTPATTPTTVPSPTPTVGMTPTPAPSPTDTTTPTPVTTPTPAPDPGFAWCPATCTNNGFQVEYPQNWQSGPASNAPGMQFTSPNAPDIYASFKALGPSQSTASTIAANDLQTTFASQPGYTVTQSGSTATISGETWFTTTATYQLNGQTERIMVYAIIHQGNAYIIELQAPDSQFDTVNGQYFNVMLAKYQFLQ
jgi:hypothetical protein